MITAKVLCTQVVNSGEGDSRQAALTFSPDYADGRNKDWSLATPHLSLSMTVRGAVADEFSSGKAYELQFVETTDQYPRGWPRVRCRGQPTWTSSARTAGRQLTWKGKNMLGLGNDYDIGLAFAPVDLQTAGFTGKRISMAGCKGIDIVLIYGAGTDGDDPVPSLQQHTAYVDGTTSDLSVISTIHRKSETTLDNDEIWAATTQTAAALMTAVADDAQKQKIYVIRVMSTNLADDYTHISANQADLSNNAQLAAGIYVRFGLASQRNPTLLPNLLNPGAANA